MARKNSKGELKMEKNKFLEVVTNFVLYNKKKLFGGALLLCTTAFLSGCAKEYEKIDASVSDVVAYNSDNSNLDEVFELNEEISIHEIDTDSLTDGLDKVITEKVKCSFVDSLSRLENYLDLAWKIEDLELKDTEELKKIDDAETIRELNEMTYEQIVDMLESYEKDDLSDLESIRVKQKIVFLRDYYQAWITKNGLNISEALLKKTIKSGVCYAVGLEPEFYGCCSITPKGDLTRASVTLVDPVTENKFTYSINGDADIIHSAINLLCEVQEMKSDIEFTKYKEILGGCSNSIEHTKLCVQSGCYLDGKDINSNDSLNVVISVDEAHEQLKTLKKIK